MFGSLALLVLVLPLTVFLVRQQQSLTGQAAPAPTLSFVPVSVPDANVGDDVELAVELRPGRNKTIKEVKFVVEYDPEKLDPSGGFENQSGLEELPQTQEFVEGRIKVALGTDDAPKFIKERKTLGSLTFTALSDTGGGKTTVRFVRGESQIVGVKNNFRPDVVNADVVIGEGEAICDVGEKGECSWEATPNADKYVVKVTETESGDVVAEENDWTETKIEFDADPGKTYKCEVFAKNECGQGGPGEDSATCQPEVTPSPTPSPSPSPTPTPTKTPTPTPTKTPTPTPTSVITPTPTPTIVVNTPTPTPTIIVQAPPPAQGGITPQPTLPPTGTGDVITTVGAFVGTALLILGGIFFFIF